MLLNRYILNDSSEEIEKMEEEFQLMYFASEIVEGTFNFFKLNEKYLMLENRRLTLKIC